MGRPRKPDGEKYRTPAVSFRPPPADLDEANALRDEGETLTDYLIAAMRREARYRKRRHAQQERG